MVDDDIKVNEKIPTILYTVGRGLMNLHSIFWIIFALALKTDKNATKSLKFNPSTILSNLCKKHRQESKTRARIIVILLLNLVCQ